MLTVDELKLKFNLTEDYELADKLGRSPGSVSNWRKAGLPGNIERKALEMLTGAGFISEPHTDYVSMPVRVLAGAGAPCDLEQLEPIDQIIVKKDLDGPHIQVVEIRGKSMEPTIVHGARIGVDTSDKIIISGV